MGESKNNKDVGANNPKLAELKVSEDFPFIVYPYGMRKVYADNDVVVSCIQNVGEIQYENWGSEGSLDSYEIEFEEDDFSLKELRDTTMEDSSDQAKTLLNIYNYQNNCLNG